MQMKDILWCLVLISFYLFAWSRYDEAPLEYKPYRQKDGALLAIGALCDKLKQTEPYKSELERMLVQHVFPEFSSPIGHLRAKVWYIQFLLFCCVALLPSIELKIYFLFVFFSFPFHTCWNGGILWKLDTNYIATSAILLGYLISLWAGYFEFLSAQLGAHEVRSKIPHLETVR